MKCGKTFYIILAVIILVVVIVIGIVMFRKKETFTLFNKFKKLGFLKQYDHGPFDIALNKSRHSDIIGKSTNTSKFTIPPSSHEGKKHTEYKGTGNP